MNKNSVGLIIQGSFSDGLIIKFKENFLPLIGDYFIVTSLDKHFFCMLADINVNMAQNEIELPENFDFNSPFGKLYLQKNSKALGKLMPLLLIKNNNISTIRELPLMFSPVKVAEKNDFEIIFGTEKLHGKNAKLFLGSPLGHETSVQVNIDLQKFIERSNGIFGKTGTGKTFITRLILAGLLKSEISTLLVFDVHGEYGLTARSEGTEEFVLGLKSLMPNKIVIFSLDPQSTRQRGVIPDVEVVFNLSEIDVEDIISLQAELNLHPTAIDAATLLASKFGKYWLTKLLSEQTDLKELATSLGAHTESLSALQRKLKRLLLLPFIQTTESTSLHGKIAEQLIEFLDRQISVILEFGRQTSKLTYLLVSGILTRQIHKSYVKKTEKFLASQRIDDRPNPLVIVVEEAHNFLNPVLAKQTIFGTIAREMRKYFVSLLVVDQRPSGICDEIISQLGTKIVAKLDDERDVLTVFSGSSDQARLKNLNNCLASTGQAIVFGHAVKLPILLSIRKYDEDFYKILKSKIINKIESAETIINDLFF